MVDVTYFPAIIIGAGQAGLAAAHELIRRGLTPQDDFIIINANDGPGGAWRHRWDSLTLGAAHGIADLPGLKMQRPDPTVPSRILVAEYYGDYEKFLGLDVVRPARVQKVRSAGERLELITPVGTYTADVILNATGTWDAPYIPYIKGVDTFQGRQLHTKDYTDRSEFADQKVLVVGGGLSAIQFLLEIEPCVKESVWATRRPPNFTNRWQYESWGLDVERAVRERTFAGKRPASVVRTTGIGMTPEYVRGVREGILVSRGMFDQITPTGVVFGEPLSHSADGLGPSASDELVFPESWQPFEAGTEVDVDVIFWNTGFRHAQRHLTPLKLRGADGGVEMKDEVTPVKDERVIMVGYGSAASTTGANRAGRKAGRAAAKALERR